MSESVKIPPGTEESKTNTPFPVDGWSSMKTLKKHELVIADGKLSYVSCKMPYALRRHLAELAWALHIIKSMAAIY